MSVSRAEALGQLLIIRLESPVPPSECEDLVRRYLPGGVLMTHRGLSSPESTRETLARIARASSTAPFLALEEEGGAIDPLAKFFPPLPAPRVVARHGLAAVKRLGALIGEALATLGFNTVFAPRLDLSCPLGKPSLDTQAFDQDARLVAQCGEAFLDGLNAFRIIACAKHFPGAGSVEDSPAKSFAVVGKPMATLWREDLLPFRQLLPSLKLVEVASAAYKAYDFDVKLPAALSSNILEGLLRVKLGFKGVAVGNLFCSLQSPMEQLVSSIKAGCDVQVVPGDERAVRQAVETLTSAWEDGTLPAPRVEEALRRIQTAKKSLGRPKGKISRSALERVSREFEQFAKEICSEEQKIA